VKGRKNRAARGRESNQMAVRCLPGHPAPAWEMGDVLIVSNEREVHRARGFKPPQQVAGLTHSKSVLGRLRNEFSAELTPRVHPELSHRVNRRAGDLIAAELRRRVRSHPWWKV